MSKLHSFGVSSGIAIGPILFIIAILALLAAAIAAGSGGFTSSTSTESNKVAAATILQIADTLQTGVDNALYQTGNSLSTLVMLPSHTTASTDVFSVTGGGITYPETHFGGNSMDVWYFGFSGNLGTSYSLAAFLPVSSDLCDAINTLVFGKIQTQPQLSQIFVDLFEFNEQFPPINKLPAPFSTSQSGCFYDVEPSNISSNYFYRIFATTPDSKSHFSQSQLIASDPAYNLMYSQLNAWSSGG